MNIPIEVLQTLFDIQTIDMQVLQKNKQLQNIPERKTILECKAKRRIIEGKKEKVASMLNAAEVKFKKICDEDDILSEKQKKIQGEIEDVKGDFRSVEARTKELAGIEKRRSTLEGEMKTADAELEQVKKVMSQIENAIKLNDAAEKSASDVFVKAGVKIKSELSKLTNERAELTKDVPKDVMNLYTEVAKKTGGVALSKLSANNTCGACRSAIEKGRVLSMKTKGNVAKCPNCERILVL